MIPHAVRYFLAIGLHSSSGIAVLIGGLLVGLWTTSLDAAALDSGLGMVMFIQMFLASSGFATRARRGHFDAIIAGTRNRARVVLAHAIVSIAPGAAAWLLLAATGWILGSPAAASALAGSRAAGLVIVSALAWSAGFMLARGAAGLAWIAALVALLLAHVDIARPAMALSDPLARAALQGLTILACPFLLIAPRPPAAPGSVAAAVAIAIAVVLWTIRASRRLDIYVVDQA